jgi:copper chaperone NosL
MIRAVALLALPLALGACRDDVAQMPDPVPLTAQATSYFCKMQVIAHPGPKAQVHLEGLPGAPLFFAQVRDAVAYLRLPEQSNPVLAVYVSDMDAATDWDNPGTDNWILADDAFYVVGSDRQGGMGGDELVPFGTDEGARAFVGDHGGQVMRLGAIPDAAVLDMRAPAPVGDSDYMTRLRALGQDDGETK